MADSRFFRLIRTKKDTESTKQPKLPVNLAGTKPTINGAIHKSTAMGDDNPNGRTGNNWVTPTPERFEINQDPGDRLQDIQNSHLSEGPNPGRIPRPWNDRNNGRIDGKGTTDRAGQIGLLLNLSGVSAGGLGDAMYIPHTSILRPAGKSVGSARTIDDGAQIPGIFLADPTRR
jgi:hypothetical protein